MGVVISVDFNPKTTVTDTTATTVTPSTTVDTDGDGLTDAFEATLGSNPLLPDSDFDGYTDYEEYMAGTNLMDATDFPSMIIAFLGLVWYWWILIIVISIVLIVGLLVMTKKIKI